MISRMLDLVLSIVALVTLLPLMIVISFALKITGEGEVFYSQKRIGMKGKIFSLVKFATMLKESPNIGPGNLTVNNDPRVLKFGRFLRKTKLNELPQLINVIYGDMSIVGPRPLTPDTFEMYSMEVQASILNVRPGLSGIGSLIFRNEEFVLLGKKNPKEFYSEQISPYKGSLECWFVRNQSIKIYFEVILLTIFMILGGSQKLIYRYFTDLPKPPLKIAQALGI